MDFSRLIGKSITLVVSLQGEKPSVLAVKLLGVEPAQGLWVEQWSVETIVPGLTGRMNLDFPANAKAFVPFSKIVLAYCS